MMKAPGCHRRATEEKRPFRDFATCRHAHDFAPARHIAAYSPRMQRHLARRCHYIEITAMADRRRAIFSRLAAA